MQLLECLIRAVGILLLTALFNLHISYVQPLLQEGQVLTMKERTRSLIRSILILLCAGLLGYGALRRFSNAPSGQEDEAAKLAELEAALIKAASTSGQERSETGAAGRTRSSRASRTRST